MAQNKIDKKIILGGLAIMLAALLWSLDGVFIRPKLYALPANLVVFIEHALGFVVLSPFIFLSWGKIKHLTRKSWGAILWVCIFGGALGTIMITKAFFAAVDGQVTFATVVILQKLQPVFALIIARILLKEKLNKQFYWWAILGIIAAYFLAFGKTGLHFSEINILHSAAFFSLIAAFAFGSSTVFGKRIVNHLDFKTTAALRFSITMIIMLALVLITGDITKFNAISTFQWELFAIIVFTSGAVAMFIYYFGLRRVTASQSTILELFWPLSAIFLDWILNHNVLNGLQWLATIVLLLAFYMIVTKGQPKTISFSAKVISGEGRGRQLGYKTANLDTVDIDITHGIYLVNITVEGKAYHGLMHFGYKETFNNNLSLEIFIKDFSQNIYGQTVSVVIIRKLREVIKFKTEAELTTQIQKDTAALQE